MPRKLVECRPLPSLQLSVECVPKSRDSAGGIPLPPSWQNVLKCAYKILQVKHDKHVIFYVTILVYRKAFLLQIKLICDSFIICKI